jgi:hypothetical protein
MGGYGAPLHRRFADRRKPPLGLLRMRIRRPEGGHERIG